MRYVQVKAGVAGFLFGPRFVVRADGPFAVDDDKRAAEMIAAGVVEGCVPLSSTMGDDLKSTVFPDPLPCEAAVMPHARKVSLKR